MIHFLKSYILNIFLYYSQVSMLRKIQMIKKSFSGQLSLNIFIFNPSTNELSYTMLLIYPIWWGCLLFPNNYYPCFDFGVWTYKALFFSSRCKISLVIFVCFLESQMKQIYYYQCALLGHHIHISLVLADLLHQLDLPHPLYCRLSISTTSEGESYYYVIFWDMKNQTCME